MLMPPLQVLQPNQLEGSLESLLMHVPFSVRVPVQLDFTENGTRTAMETAAYVAPGQVIEGNFYMGFYFGQKKNPLHYISIGLSAHIGYETVYSDYVKSEWEPTSAPSEGTLYLPLRASRLKTNLGHGNGNYIKGSPFSVLTLDGVADPAFPFFFLGETDKQVGLEGFYLNGGKICSFPYLEPDPAWRTVLNEITQGRYAFPLAGTISPEKLIRTLHTKPVAASAPLRERPASANIQWENPASIKAYLDQFVVGQEHAKKTLAVAFSMYQTIVEHSSATLPRPHALLAGPTGTGKTYMVELLIEQSKIPYSKGNFTGKSSEGYYGQNLSAVFKRVRQKTKGDAPYGIILLNELDKLALVHSTGKDFFGTKMQQELLGWLEGERIQLISYNEGGHKSEEWMDTKNLLFITTGAFGGTGDLSLEEIIAKRLGVNQRRIGFGSLEKTSQKSLLEQCEPEDIIAYGLMPELVGRIPILGMLTPLSMEDKVKILTDAKQSILEQYHSLLKLRGWNLVVEPAALRCIAEQCPEGTGARALRSICGRLFTKIMYDPKPFATGDIITVDENLTASLLGESVPEQEREAEP